MTRQTRMTPARRLRGLRTLSAVIGVAPPTAGQPLPDTIAAVLEVAASQRLSATLWLGVERAGWQDAISPSDARTLKWANRRAGLSAARFQAQLAEVLRELAGAAIDVLVLKGGVLLAEVEGHPLTVAQVTVARSREMYDLDVCVAPADYEKASELLLQLGYLRAPLWRFEPDHAETFARENEVGTIDLHHAIGVSVARELLPLDQVRAGSLSATVLGAPCRVLSPTDALIHDVVHSQLADLNFRIGGLPLRQLHSFTQLYTRWASPEIWQEVQDRFAAAGLEAVLSAHCEMARSLFGLTIEVPERSIAARRHLARCMALFAVGHIPDVHRNLTRAFGADYMRSEYGDAPLILVRGRHAAKLVRRKRRGLLPEVFDASVR